MPLTALQRRILGAIARNRNPDSYLAGGAPINRDGKRFSRDLDIFHDPGPAVLHAMAADEQTLIDAGLTVTWELRADSFGRALIAEGGEQTRLEWGLDSDFRVFPVIPDSEFGYVLHPIDLATNKLVAAAERREARDAVDLLTIAERVLPLGPLAWAAAEKNPGHTPEELISEVRRRARYHDDELRALALAPPIAAAALNNTLRALLDTADEFVAGVPRSVELGLILDERGEPVRSIEQLSGELHVHHGSRKGSWPGGSTILGAMLDRTIRDGS